MVWPSHEHMGTHLDASPGQLLTSCVYSAREFSSLGLSLLSCRIGITKPTSHCLCGASEPLVSSRIHLYEPALGKVA